VDDCVFCKIVAGEIPSHTIYEDDKTKAFLGITPPVEGFTLVIPKVHSNELWYMEDDDYQALMNTVRKIGQHLRRQFNTARVGLQVEGLDVSHTHVKILPFSTAGQFRALEPSQESDHDALGKLAKGLRFED